MAAINFLSDNYAATARWMMGPTQLVEIIDEVAFLFLLVMLSLFTLFDSSTCMKRSKE